MFDLIFFILVMIGVIRLFISVVEIIDKIKSELYRRKLRKNFCKKYGHSWTITNYIKNGKKIHKRKCKHCNRKIKFNS